MPVDAAIAANAVLGVVEPYMNGMGGDLFAMVYDAGRDALHGLNASGPAPGGLSPELLLRRGMAAMPATGHPQRDGAGRRGGMGGPARALRRCRSRTR
jgi:gamma-glutamyltranspeptidase/glutathione hydrolase